jgi:hypothetical protein
LGISADAMASLGLVEREGDRYRNSAAAAAFLAGAPGPDLRPMLRVFDRISYGLWMNLEAAVRAGEGQRQFGGFTADQRRSFPPASRQLPRPPRPRSRQITISAGIAASSTSAAAPARS